jgi:Zn-dependent peptidase ImmA (M78 family)/transcriptional regulator with XRE-family HTH domain
MAKPVAAVNHKILTWARERSGQTIDQVAAKLHKDPAVIAAWEAGTDAPSYPQLETLAYKIYKRPLAVFFFPAPPPEEDPKTSFRTLPDFEIEDLHPDTRLKIRQARAFQVSLSELNDGKNPAEQKIFIDLHVRNGAAAGEVAAKARSYLGIDAKVQRSWNGNDQALKAWRRAVEDKGVYVFKNSFKQKDVSGFCLYDTEFPIIYVNNSTAQTRQIFTILHELGHILTATGGVTKRDDSYIAKLTGPDRQIEIFCNRFAAEALLPLGEFKNALGPNPASDESIAQIANGYRVSRHVVLLRLLGLDLVSQGFYEQKVAEWKADYDAKKPEKGGGSYYNTQGAYFGEKFLNLAFGKYYDGKISIEQLADYLNVKESSVPGIEQLVLQGEG